MAARKTTKTATIDPNSVSIADFCQSQGINEQIFRIELMQHVDDADSTKTVAFDVAQTVSSTIQATSKALPATQEPAPEPTATAENLTPQELQPSQETAPQEPQKPQNSHMVASAPKNIAKTPDLTNASNIPTALQELIFESEEIIDLADLVHTYRNQQIIQNAQTRDSELVLQLRERRIETRSQVFDSLRSLNSRQPVPQELPELPASLQEEIKALSDELGKPLAA